MTRRDNRDAPVNRRIQMDGRSTPSLVGMVFGRLRVVRRASSKGAHSTYWECECSCGNTAVTRTAHLLNEKTRSCGCLTRENNGGWKHGGAHSATYKAWQSIISRCTNPNDAVSFSRYGGRGITVCDRWLHSFENFRADMGDRPSPEYSIDRIDNDGNYEPGNCRWATRTQQARNRRSCRLIQYNGITATLADWADRLGLPKQVLYNRIRKGWSEERALLEPVMRGPFAARDFREQDKHRVRG